MNMFIGKVLGKKQKFYIKYRWHIENYPTNWSIYRVFKNKKLRDAFYEKLIKKKALDFVEYKVI